MQSQDKTKTALTFAIHHCGRLVRREIITQDIVKVGRDPRSHLRVDDDRVGRMHAVIEVVSPDEITLVDLGNEAGTSINGARVHKSTLSVGDHIQVGDTSLVLDNVQAVTCASGSSPAPNPFLNGPEAATNMFQGLDANPFAASSDPSESSERDYKYVMTKCAPDVDPDEVELSNVPSLEVMILWGDTVLHVRHLTPPRDFYVGEEEGKNLACDYFIPTEKLGASRAPIVLTTPGGGVSLVVLPRAKGSIDVPGKGRTRLEEAAAQGRLQPCAELSGAYQIEIPPGSRARMEVGDLVFQIAAVNAGRKVEAGLFSQDRSGGMYVALSMLAHVGLLSAMAFFVPALGLTDSEEANRDQLFLLQHYWSAIQEREMDAKDTDQTAEERPDQKEGGTGNRAKGDEGATGTPTSRDVGRRYAVKGPADTVDPHIAREAALREAATIGLIGILNSRASGDPDSPTAPWGRDTSLGTDPISARGNMWGDSIGDSFGSGGLGLTGIGEGGGGRGEGIGLGSVGTIGHGAGTGLGQGFGPGGGNGIGVTGRGHKTAAPQVRPGVTVVNGRLPPEVIQRIVRQNYGRFRVCYESGLRSNPSLQGRVAVRFVIGRDGAVSNVGNGGSDLPDPQVVQCVIRAYYGLSFPEPENGIVSVVYPIMFSPGG